MDKRSITSAINGKKGGRKPGLASIEAERQRDYLAQVLIKEFAPIVAVAVKQAKKGDKSAREWLADRAFGKATNAVEISNPDGSLKTIIIQKA